MGRVRHSPRSKSIPSGDLAGRKLGRVLIVEPDRLTRWSLRTFLENWFDVIVADTPAAALIGVRVPTDALLLAGELPSEASDEIERQARGANEKVRVVHLCSDIERSRHPNEDCMEKPFDLAKLAERLGVPADEFD
ncbi:MAG: response regulator transcription factor [Planctomycetes bacterium]|nr:response regulator transcription factor [Planctomycetota bacterium]